MEQPVLVKSMVDCLFQVEAEVFSSAEISSARTYIFCFLRRGGELGRWT